MSPFPFGRRMLAAASSAVALCFSVVPARSADMPKLVHQQDRYALTVDGKPFLVLGAQINNSSSWPSSMEKVWPAVEAMHVNTIEAPVYWEQMEPRPGQFDFSTADMLIDQARTHHVHLVILWFGTWKNGEMHYVPEWVKTDTAHYPRMIDERGEPIQVLSANAPANLEADRKAFTALMRHLREKDGDQHTVILLQVENESGAIGSVRDFSPMAQRQFEGEVPASLVKALHQRPGTWKQVFGPDADETFQAYSVAHYIDQVAQAGKAEFPLPMYCNVWVQGSLGYVIRGRQNPGFSYPSGGPVQTMIDVWKASAPSIDMLGPDIYTNDRQAYKAVVDAYRRADNPVWIPETGQGAEYATYFFYALGKGAIGFSPFGIDQTDWTYSAGEYPKEHGANYELLGPMDDVIAQLNYDGKLKTAIEEEGKPETTMDLGPWQALVGFGRKQRDGSQHAPGTSDHHGRALIAQIGPDEFLVTGFDARVTFYSAGNAPGKHLQILRAEEGRYQNGQWQMQRLLNGDQTDRGINFTSGDAIVHIKLGTY